MGETAVWSDEVDRVFLGDVSDLSESAIAERGTRIDARYRLMCAEASESYEVSSYLDVPREVRQRIGRWLGHQHRISRGLDPLSGDKTNERRRAERRAARENGGDDDGNDD